MLVYWFAALTACAPIYVGRSELQGCEALDRIFSQKIRTLAITSDNRNKMHKSRERGPISIWGKLAMYSQT